jgi:hypothetical protein
MQVSKMKTTKIIVLSVALVALSQCKKNPPEPYSNEKIVMDNAQAALYFHTVFREAENAWAFIHDREYVEKTYTDSASTQAVFKKLTYGPYKDVVTKKMMTIEYNEWESNQLLLRGQMDVIFDKDSSYRKDGKIANVELKDFSINGQNVVGEVTLKYKKSASNPDVPPKDQYTFTLLNGAAICEKDYSSTVLISCAIANGQYERTTGYGTLDQEDDVWIFSGATTGMLRNDPNLKYTNTVIASIT